MPGSSQAHREMGTPQPASLLLELIGMLGLNSLVLVKHLVMFWWKVLGLCSGEVWLCNAGLWCWEEPVWADGPVVKVVLKAGMVRCKTSPCHWWESCPVKDKLWAVSDCRAAAGSCSPEHWVSPQHAKCYCRTDGEERIRLFGLCPGWAAEVFGFLSPQSDQNS